MAETKSGALHSIFKVAPKDPESTYIYADVCVRVLAGDHKANSMNKEDGQQQFKSNSSASMNLDKRVRP